MNPGPGGQHASRATLLLTRDCNNRCVTCPALREGAEFDADGTLARAATEGVGVSFVGGEPTLAPELATLVGRARAMGIHPIGLQTNARVLGKASLAARLRDAGLTDVHVTLFGAESRVHDYHTGVPGSFAETMAGIGAARAASLETVVSVVVTRSNTRNLSPIAPLLASRGVRTMRFVVPLARGRAAEDFDRVLPRLGISAPFVVHAVATAEKVGVRAWVSGMPLCLLGPYAAAHLAAAEDGARGFGAACERCEARSACPGLDPAYLARFGGDELNGRAAPSLRPVDVPAAAFVGPAELAPGPSRAIPEPPKAARRHLPQLARPTPGVAERRGVPTQSGDALRTLFPGLFDPEESR